MKKSVYLAWYNYKNYRREKRSFSALFIFCTVILLVMITISDGFVTICNSYKTDDVSLREIQLWPVDNSDTIAPFDTKTSKKICGLPEVVDSSQYFNIFLSDNYYIAIDDLELECISSIRGTNSSYSFAPMTTILDMNDKIYEDPIIFGRNFDEKKWAEAIIDENACYLIGLDKPEEAIGKHIAVILSDITISDIEIVGVCSGKYGNYGNDLSTWDKYSIKEQQKSVQCNPLFFSDGVISEILKSCDVEDWTYENLIVLVDNTDNVKKICDTAKNLYGYESSNMISVIESKSENIKSVRIFLFCLVFVMLLISVIVLINTLLVKMQGQRKLSEMAIKIGYRRNDLSLAYMLENEITTIKSSLISFMLSLLISIVFDMFLMSFYSTVTSYNRFVFLINLPAAVIIFTCMAVFVGLLTYVISSIQISIIERNIFHKS